MSGVPHHTPPDLAVSAPLLSYTPTPVGSLVKGSIKGWGDDDKGGRQPLVTSPSCGRRPHRSATFLNQAPAVGVGWAGIPLWATLPLAPRRNRDRETGF